MKYQNQDEARERLIREGERDVDTVVQPENGGKGVGRRPWGLAESLSIFSFFAALASLMLSLSFGRTPDSPTAGVLRRPNAYIGLDKVHYPKNFTFPSKKHWPITSFQVGAEDPKRALVQTVRQQQTVAGTVGLDDHYVLISGTRSTILQFRATDWGMERCVLHLLIPRNDLDRTARSESFVDVWELDNTAELAPGIAWGHAPQRVMKLASLPFVAGESAGNLAIECKSGTFPTFEFACAVGTTACFVEFWQNVPVYIDGIRWKTNGVYVEQHWSRNDAGVADEEVEAVPSVRAKPRDG